MEIKNAVIKSVSLGTDDHGFLTVWLQLEYDIGGQAFGGYALYLPKIFDHHEIKSFAGHFICRVMEIASVINWRDIKGKTIRVKCEPSKVFEIGHIIKDDWFNPSEDFRFAEKEK